MDDTIHCKLCGFRTTCGDTDHVVTNGGDCICVGCAEEIIKLYRESLGDAGICEHGVNDGDFCQECNAEYKRARQKYGDE